MVPLFSTLRQKINTETERDEPRHYGLRHAIYIHGNYILVDVVSCHVPAYGAIYHVPRRQSGINCYSSKQPYSLIENFCAAAKQKDNVNSHLLLDSACAIIVQNYLYKRRLLVAIFPPEYFL